MSIFTEKLLREARLHYLGQYCFKLWCLLTEKAVQPYPLFHMLSRLKAAWTRYSFFTPYQLMGLACFVRKRKIKKNNFIYA